MPEFLRLDEFSKTADGVLDARDRRRFACVGFDFIFTGPDPKIVRITGEAMFRSDLVNEAAMVIVFDDETMVA